MDEARLINKALSNSDIQGILGGDAKITVNAELGNRCDIDHLLPNYCIILYEDRPNREHWTALSQHNGLYEHFDSYGAKPNSELKWIGEKRNRHLNQDEPCLTQLQKKEEEKCIYNNVTHQSKDSRVNACGSNAVHRLYRLENNITSLSDYYQFMKSITEKTNARRDRGRGNLL